MTIELGGDRYICLSIFVCLDVGVVSPAILQDTPAGMEALEVLHNQLQLLVWISCFMYMHANFK